MHEQISSWFIRLYPESIPQNQFLGIFLDLHLSPHIYVSFLSQSILGHDLRLVFSRARGARGKPGAHHQEGTVLRILGGEKIEVELCQVEVEAS